MKFELKKNLRGASDEEALNELWQCAKSIGRDTITMAEYEEVGSAHPSFFQRRFGSWSKALEAAGLEQSRSKIGISDDELMNNLKDVWITLARQPSYSEIKKPLSTFSSGTYEKRYGGWTNALEKFVEWANQDIEELETKEPSSKISSLKSPKKKKRTKREISERLRFRVLVRDGFRCLSCGASPLSTPGVELHVDHIKPWSKGGETVLENLQSKCSRCNLGKGNAFDA